jgi:hypothetical protein
VFGALALLAELENTPVLEVIRLRSALAALTGGGVGERPEEDRQGLAGAQATALLRALGYWSNGNRRAGRQGEKN